MDFHLKLIINFHILYGQNDLVYNRLWHKHIYKLNY